MNKIDRRMRERSRKRVKNMKKWKEKKKRKKRRRMMMMVRRKWRRKKVMVVVVGLVEICVGWGNETREQNCECV